MARPVAAVNEVTVWTLEADSLGHGGANWHTLAIMHRAMHDAINAIEPRYARWLPPEADEPPARGASIPAALAAAAAQVMVDLHPTRQAEITARYQEILRRITPAPAVYQGLAVGMAIGRAAVRDRAEDGFNRVYPFPGDDLPGRWRPTPPDFTASTKTAIRPFLMPTRIWPGATPPPASTDPAFLADVAEVKRVGGRDNSARTPEQTYVGRYWAFQSSQRGFVQLAVRLMDSDPLPGGLHDHARAMAQLTNALADSAIMAWSEKEQFSFWRPITVIRAGLVGLPPDPDWQPLIDTPQHPEYPSGHSTDCFTGAAVLAAVWGTGLGPVEYVAQSGMPLDGPLEMGMGQHAQAETLSSIRRQYPSLGAAAEECAQSRIWAGAHFRGTNEESRRLATTITERALATVPPVPSGQLAPTRP